jgi:bisphosphoglycerate-independent phosphoglycerate mutase (AlkP superfamily)
MKKNNKGLRGEAQGAETQEVNDTQRVINQLHSVILTDFQAEKMTEISNLIERNNEREFNARSSAASEHFLGRYQAAAEIFEELRLLESQSIHMSLNAVLSQIRAKISVYGDHIFQDTNENQDPESSQDPISDNK